LYDKHNSCQQNQKSCGLQGKPAGVKKNKEASGKEFYQHIKIQPAKKLLPGLASRYLADLVFIL
jgi:hypothetical protein